MRIAIASEGKEEKDKIVVITVYAFYFGGE